MRLVVGEEHRTAFRDIYLDLWPNLADLDAGKHPEVIQAILKAWLEWTALPAPCSHEDWKAAWHWVGLTPPDEITDERITSELKPALLAKHRRDIQDKQRRQDERDIANKMAEAATKLSSLAKKRKRGGQRKYDSKLKKQIREAWATKKHKTYEDCDIFLGQPLGTTKKVLDTTRKKP